MADQKEPRRRSCSRAEMPVSFDRGCWNNMSDRGFLRLTVAERTRSDSRAAMRSIGMRTQTNKMERIAKPLAARVLNFLSAF